MEAFHTKCLDTGIHSGIIVSASGFYKSAIVKAARYNIGCMSLDQAEGFDWCVAPGIYMYRRFTTQTHIRVVFSDGAPVEKDSLQLEDGTPVTLDIAKVWTANALNQYHPMPREGAGENRVQLRELNPNLYGIRDGSLLRASELQFLIDYLVKIDFTPFSFRTYTDMGKSKNITQAAVCEVAVTEDRFGDIVLSTNDLGEINIAFIGRDT